MQTNPNEPSVPELPGAEARPARLAAPPLPPPPPATEYVAMDKPFGLLRVAETILKHPERTVYELHHGNAPALSGMELCISVVCLLAYGLTVGTFSMGDQLWAAPLKITLGVLFSALICLPSLFVFSCLSGADSQPSRLLGTLTGVITVSSLLLLAFGPVSWIFSQSTQSIVFMGALQLAFWLIAVYYGLRYLHKSVYMPGAGKHLAIWGIIFVLVTLQMTTTLRPILGSSPTLLQKEKMFFLTHWSRTIDDEARNAVRR